MLTPNHHSNFFSKSFVITEARLWNTLPNDIRDCNAKARFGASLKWFLSTDSCGLKLSLIFYSNMYI
jgi:hypothetical protein